MVDESKIESMLKENVEKLGGICYKFVSPGNVGVPDRLCALPYGVTFFVECKGTDGETSSKQIREMLELRKLKHNVYACRSLEELSALLILMRREVNNATSRLQGLPPISEERNS